MFKKLSRRIMLITISGLSFCIAVMGVFAYQWAKKTVLFETVQVSSNYFRSSNDLLEQYLNYIGETAKMIANNPGITETAWRPNVPPSKVSLLLDRLTFGMNMDVKGISLYRPDGTVFTLSGMSNVPSMEKLKEEEPIRRFMNDSGEQWKWLSRYKNLSPYYYDRYSTNGTFSYLLKWTVSEGGTPGTMIVDLDADKLFGFFRTDNDLFRHNCLFLIRDGENIVHSSLSGSADDAAPQDLTQLNNGLEGRFISADGDQLYLYHTVMNSNVKIVVSIPPRDSVSNLSALKWSIVLLGPLSGLFAVILALMLKRSVTRPLAQLYGRMRAFR
ncbi:cache domain-containing protein [Paenibacillus sp. P25]|nr:cache domain-containing protein [Paenibacillus sp. P25]